MIDSKKIGNTLKRLRLNKKITQKQLANGIMSVDYLIRVERGSTNISFQFLYQILDRLNIDFNEFLYILNDYNIYDSFSDKEVSVRYLSAYYANNKVQIEEIRNELIAKYDDTSLIFYKHILILCDVLSGSYNQAEVSEIVEYLKNLKVYTSYDFNLFSNMIDAFSDDEVESLSERMLDQFLKFEMLLIQKNLSSSFFLNVTNRLILMLKFDSARKYIDLTHDYLSKSKDVFSKLYLKTHEAKIFILSDENPDLGFSIYSDVVDFFRFVGEDKVADELENEAKNYKEFKEGGGRVDRMV